MNLLIATRNPNKLAEIRDILKVPDLELISALDFPEIPDVVEDGTTLDANAVKKAVELHRATGLWTLADDSGVEVDALGGAPGVYSARYAGEPCDPAANIAKLLAALGPRPDRVARFRCVIALTGPGFPPRTVEGRIEGAITLKPRGTGGFGYDPIFTPDGFDRTFAELDAETKNAISHRGRALTAARDAWTHVFLRLSTPTGCGGAKTSA